MLSLKELTHGKVRFGLIVLAIALVVSLTFLMSAMSDGLVSGMTGAKRSIQADVLVFQAHSRLALERSFLDTQALEEISTAPGVREVYGVGYVPLALTVHSASRKEPPDDPQSPEPLDARLFGLDGHWAQLPAAEGQTFPPAHGEVIIDATARAEGIRLGDVVRTSPGDLELRVAGFTENRRYIMAPAAYVPIQTWREVYLASVLGADDMEATPDAAQEASEGPRALDGSASIAAVLLEDDTSVADLAATLRDTYEVATPADAALAANGMEVMVLAVDGIQMVSLLIGALVIGVFFYVTTLNKSMQIAALKALGASNRKLYIQLVVQIGVLVTAAIGVGTAVSLGAGASMPPTMAFDPDAAGWVLTALSVYGMAFVGSLFSLRSILKIDPATALDAGDH